MGSHHERGPGGNAKFCELFNIFAMSWHVGGFLRSELKQSRFILAGMRALAAGHVSCRSPVLVVQPTEDRDGDDGSVRSVARRLSRDRNAMPESLVRPTCVEVGDIFAEHAVQMPFAQNEDPVEALSAHASQKALADRVHVWGAKGRLNDPGARALRGRVVSCKAVLTSKSGGDDLRFFVGGGLPAGASLTVNVALASGPLAPGTYSAADLSADSVVALSTTSPSAQYATHEAMPPAGTSLSATLTSVDPPPATLLDPASSTHGSVHATLVRVDAQGPAETVDLSF
jgi:hypothetical protein